MKTTLINALTDYPEPIIQLLNKGYWKGYVPAKLVSKVCEGGGIVSYTFKVNSRYFLNFIPGQHICIAVEINGRRLERYFSISSPASELVENQRLSISIKQQNDGKVTPWMATALNPGDTIHIKNMAGDFYPKQSQAPGIFIAAGSGVTPILSILESMQKESLANHQLIYSTRGARPPFYSRLKSLQDAGLSLILHNSSMQGRVTQHTLAEYGCSTYRQAFICGPSDFAQSMTDSLTRIGLDKAHIHAEHFHPISRTSEARGATVRWHTLTGDICESTSSGRSLLEEAEDAGKSPIFGCRAGICHQCSATKLRGQVRNLISGALSDSGKQEIQLCICTAESDLELEIRERNT